MTAAPTTRAEAAKRLLALRAAEQSFLGFVKLLHPDWELPRFQLDLIDKLDRLTSRTLLNEKRKPVRNLLITMPPRHSKSTFSTVYLPAYFMAKDPRRFIMSASYNAGLATDFGRQVRDTFTNPDVRQAFEANIDERAKANDLWRTEEGGAYFGVGVGGTTTGRPANLLIIDDPIKAREEAESITMRNKVWDFYTSGLSTRLQPEANGDDPIQLVILTRWHPDDLAGRIMQTEDWKEGRWMHVNYPAIRTIKSLVWRCDLDKDHPLYMTRDQLNRTVSPGKREIEVESEKALWPKRFPLEELQRRRRLNPRDFASLYQQQPYIEGGNILKTEWWRYYGDEEDGEVLPANFQSVIIAADTAFKKDETADFSVAVVAGLTHEGDIYILDVIRGRWDYPDLRQRLVSLNALWRGKGLRALYIEDKASGQSLVQELRRESGISVIPYKVTRDKVARANAATPLIEGGRVYLPKRAKWLDDFISETTAFPSSPHDDQVDALTMALDILSRQAITPEAIFGTLDASSSLLSQAKRRAPNKQFHRWGES